MRPDYFSILSNAVENAESAAARQRIYARARRAVAGLQPSPDLSSLQISAEVSALEKAIQQIEQELHEAEWRPDESVYVSPPAPKKAVWKPIAVVALGVAVVASLSTAVYWYGSSRNFGRTAAGGLSSATMRTQIVPDLDPGIDGGSSGEKLPFPLQRQVIFYRTTVVPGSIVVDREKLFLYLIQPGNAARRYGIGITQECSKSGSLYRIASKVEWPEWKPQLGAAGGRANVASSMPGGPGNPMGARALLLDQPERLIHGTNSPQTIGHFVSRGCIRLVNDDVEDLYRRVSLETKVIMRN